MDSVLKRQKQLFQKYLHFHEDLLKVQVKNMQRLVAIMSFQNLNTIDIETKIENGQHIITPQDVLIDEKELEHIFDDVLPIIKKYYSNQGELEHLDDLNDKRKLSFKLIVQKVLIRKEDEWNDLANQYNLPKKLLKKIGEYISAPYLELCSEYFNKKIQAKQWQQSNCPICGNAPTMAAINERSNSRKLWCRLCDTEWQFKPDICPFCYNEDMQKISHIFLPEMSANRVDACENCKKYIKVIDEELLNSEPNFIVDNISTFHLDIFAVMKGYTNLNILN
jgi:formate dehydrogenase maturation protein FdhE